jgi:hypothetical protein
VLTEPVGAVWSVVADFHGIAKWVRRIRGSNCELGSGPGAVGTVRWLTLEPDGRQVGERLVRYDESARLYSYEFVEPKPFPVRAYRGTLRLLPVTATDSTFLQWYGDFDADAEDVERLTASFITTYTEFASDLADYLSRRPHPVEAAAALNHTGLATQQPKSRTSPNT